MNLELAAGDLALLTAMVGTDPVKQAAWCVKQLHNALKRQPDAAILSEFEDFWNIYPRKEGKGAARKAYQSARQKVDAGTILRGLATYSIARRDSERKFIAMPSTWLNQERWSDELPAAPEARIYASNDPYYADRSKIDHFLKTGRWIGIGLPPTDKLTLIPRELLREFAPRFRAKGIEIPALL